MRFDHHDTSLWFGTGDAPAPMGFVADGSGVSLVAAIQPIDARTTVEVRYRIGDDTSTQRLLARWERTDHSEGIQYFRAEFPHLPLGERVRYSVVGHRAGIQIPPSEDTESFAASFTVGASPRASGSSASKTCACERPRIAGGKARILLTPSVSLDHEVLQKVRQFGSLEVGGDVGDHDCVVVAAREVGSDLVRDAYLQNRGVLVLEASEQTKRELCELFIGFATGGACSAYFFQKQQPRRVRVVELPADGWRVEQGETSCGGEPGGPEPLLEAPRFSPRHPETVDRFATHLFDSLLVTKFDNPEGDIPPDVDHMQIHATASGTVTHGSQVSHLDLTYDAIAFLNSPTHGTANQVLFLESRALAYPGTLKDYSTYTKGWIQNRLEYSAEVVGQPEGLFGLFGHTPKNTAKETTVTTNLGFDIAYSGGTFKFSRSKSESIKDWEVIDQSRRLKAYWTYAQMKPFPAVHDIDCCAGSDCPFTFWDHAAGYGTLSRYTLTAETMASWRTTRVTSSTVEISTAASLRLGHYHSYGIGWKCARPSLIYVNRSLYLDFSKIAG